MLAAFFVATFGCACGSTTPRNGGDPATHDGDAAAVDHGHQGHGDGHHGHGAHGPRRPFANADAWTNVFDDPERDAWQRPGAVIAALDLTPTMIVADVGAGTGYFTMRLAQAVPRGEVIAIDAEPDMLRLVAERAAREQLTNVRSVLATHASSGLAPASVDRVLVVNVWHHVANRVDYARDLAAALRPGGRLVIVDYATAAQVGPPAHMRLSPERLVAELSEAGLTARLLPLELRDQYVVEARRRP